MINKWPKAGPVPSFLGVIDGESNVNKPGDTEEDTNEGASEGFRHIPWLGSSVYHYQTDYLIDFQRKPSAGTSDRRRETREREQ